MYLFIILMATLLLLSIVTVVAVSVGGAAFIVVFGDVIVCIFLISWLIKKLVSKKRKR